MFSALLSGLRSLRVSLVTGAILVGSMYIFLYDVLANAMTVRPAVLSILALSSYIPLILVVFLCLTVGSLYTTLLEGIVDWLHRKNVNTDGANQRSPWTSAIVRSFLPYSDSAKRRLVEEVVRFYRQYSTHIETGNRGEATFLGSVLIETLWMEGKLAGTVLESPYDKIRSEGEIRVSAGLLLPLAGAAAAHAVSGNAVHLVASILGGVIVAVPMVNYGLYYYRKANSFLAHHIADGNLLAPSMETLKRANVTSLASEDVAGSARAPAADDQEPS